MKVFISPTSVTTNDGIHRVVLAQKKYLPHYGVELVDRVEEADVINAHIATYTEVPQGIPLVISNHGFHFDDFEGWGRSAYTLNRHVLPSIIKADIVTTPSYWIQHAIQRATLVDPMVVHHGIDVEEWESGENRGYVLWNKSRQDAACNPIDMNTLARLVPDIRFMSTFGVPTENVVITGKTSFEDMREFIRHAGVYLDTARESGGPCFGVLEAMACGIPILSWDFGGTAEAVVHGETGYLAQHGNFKDLLEGLHYCIQHRERLGANGRQLVIDQYQLKETVLGYVDAYQDALEEKDRYKTNVSVIITAYNVGEYLDKSIQSVLNQEYDSFELIIVDDNSQDNCGLIADKYKENENVTVIHNSNNLHVSDARNIGVINSTGRYILPLDGDDCLMPGAIQRLATALDADRSLQIAAGHLSLYFSEDNIQPSAWPNNTDLYTQLDGHNRLPYSSMYRRSMFDRLGGYRRRIRSGVEDADLWTRALSYGYKAEIVTTASTLLYTLRGDSLSRTNKPGDWLAWFPWASDRRKLPAGAIATNSHPDDQVFRSFDKPVLSVVIPVGPGHAHHIQACIDSLLAQTLLEWEAVIVNDTGEPLDSFYISGFPFVTIVDSDSNHGVAWARNRGVEAARSDRIVFLDVDDIAQPEMLNVLYRTHLAVDGWVYGDYYYDNDKEVVKNASKDWSAKDLTTKSLGPITGIYFKEDIESIGGFEEDIPGWEDWDFHLSLLDKGICGTRVVYPLIIYNMHLGYRREDNFERSQELVQYIYNKHESLINRIRKGDEMGCCGRGGNRSVAVRTSSVAKSAVTEDQVWIKYIGPQMQGQRMRSKVQRGVSYKFDGRKKREFKVLSGDVDWITNYAHFEAIGPDIQHPTETLKEDVLVIDTTSELVQPERVAPKEEPAEMPSMEIPWTLITELNLDAPTMTLLIKNFDAIEQIENVSDDQLRSIKGLGEGRVAAIREAISVWRSTDSGS